MDKETDASAGPTRSRPRPPKKKSESAQSPLLEGALRATKERFGFDSLRPHQAEVLGHVLEGRDTLAVLPTGSGKSLCYALPALLRPGLVLVVSPLIALIRDQARKFAEYGLDCASLDSLQTQDEKSEVWQRLDRGELKLLLVSPERLARVDFRERLLKLPLQMVAIDEAHCISHWGAHFRPDYRFLGEYLAELGPVQKLAVTATATAKVRDDIAKSLRLSAPATVWADFARGNLKLNVVKADKVAAQLSALLQAVLASDGPGIVYAPTRKNARDVHRMLVDANVKATLYHAGLTPDQRRQAQKSFMDGQSRVVVATHAFGMGIDKADIRFVHHAGLPGSLEQYVQEIGRAGRDGKAATCSLIYGPRDYYVQKFMIDKSFPELRVLEAVLHTAREAASGPFGVSEGALLRSLGASMTQTPPEDLAEALRVLCREGLLDELRVSGSMTGEGVEIMIGEGDPSLDYDVLSEYPLRKMDHMAKLDAIKTYVGLAAERAAFLDRYFQA